VFCICCSNDCVGSDNVVIGEFILEVGQWFLESFGDGPVIHPGEVVDLLKDGG